MTPRDFCSSGTCEALKGSAHVGLGVFAAACFIYNVVAWCYRRESHLAVNGLVYGAVTAYEVSKVKHHLK
jgi:hypothetical protein